MTGSTFFISSPHTKEECLDALDAVSQKGPEQLNQWHWGCQAGDHTGYAIIQASSDSEARGHVPGIVRNKARVTRVDTLTQQQIKSYHEMQPSQSRNR